MNWHVNIILITFTFVQSFFSSAACLLSLMHLFPACDIEQLKRFASGGYCDESTIVYLQHPCVVLTALEVLGYQVVASSSTSIKQDYNEYMWTMRKEFSEPEPMANKPSKPLLVFQLVFIHST